MAKITISGLDGFAISIRDAAFVRATEEKLEVPAATVTHFKETMTANELKQLEQLHNLVTP